MKQVGRSVGRQQLEQQPPPVDTSGMPDQVRWRPDQIRWGPDQIRWRMVIALIIVTVAIGAAVLFFDEPKLDTFAQLCGCSVAGT